MSTTVDGCRSVVDDFYELHNFYNCIGTIYGKHIKIKHPSGTRALYYIINTKALVVSSFR